MTVRGVEVRVHPTFLVLLLACFWLGHLGQVAAVFVFVVAHELAHAAAAFCFGVEVKRIELYPYGGAAVLSDSFMGKRREEVLIALAGPFFSLFLFLVLQGLSGASFGGDVLADMAGVNFWLAFFNLWPVLPLDGGRVVRALLCGRLGFVPVTRFLASAGQLLGASLVFLGLVFQAFHVLFYEPIMLILLGVFLWFGCSKEKENAQILFLKQLYRKRESLLRQGHLPGRWFAAHRGTELKQLVSQFTPDTYALVYIPGETDSQGRMIDETEVLAEIAEKGPGGRAGDIGR